MAARSVGIRGLLDHALVCLIHTLACLNKGSIDLSLSVLNHRRTIITPDVKTVNFLSPPTTTPATINPRPHYKRQTYIYSY